jgi:mannose-6-phosphate isomerase-like protein (cupin superfamily)
LGADLNLHRFKIEYQKTGNKTLTNKELIIVINGNIRDESSDVFLTGEKKWLFFDEDTYFLRIFNIDKEYGNIDVNNYTRGWLIGNFEPSIRKETEYEVGLLNHKKNEKWAFHYHKESTEINILLSGKMVINNKELKAGHVFIFDKNIIACPIFLDNCKIICIKIPSVPGDKMII